MFARSFPDPSKVRLPARSAQSYPLSGRERDPLAGGRSNYRGDVRIGQDYMSDALAQAAVALGTAQPGATYNKNGMENRMQYAPAAGCGMSPSGFGATYGCMDPCRAPVAYAGNRVQNVPNNGSQAITITPQVPFKPLKMIIVNGVNWLVTNVTVGLRNFLAGGSVSGLFFADTEVETGRWDLPCISPVLPLTLTATNISGGALDLIVSVQGGIAG